MRALSRRGMLGLGAGAAAAVGLSGCGTLTQSDGSTPTPGSHGGGSGKPSHPARPLGDGSTSFTGKQPHQPGKPEPLEPGQTPPQFVIFSWDGAGEVGNGLFPRFLDLAKQHQASMTFFLSGLYLLPESKKRLYNPPNNPRGASDIGYLTDEHVKATLANVHRAWLEGHEIGTHFNGHFCSGFGTVGNWTPAQWQSEIQQAKAFVKEWRTNTGWTDLPSLPFDYDKELVGGRTLSARPEQPAAHRQEARLALRRLLARRPPGLARQEAGCVGPAAAAGPLPGRSFEVLSMDYNMLANQSVNSTNAPAYNYPAWRTQSTQAYISGFKRAYETNRAPFFVGNHFEHWNGGIYMDSVEAAFKHIAQEKEKGADVRMVSFRQFVDWMDVQKPEVLAKLRTLDVGQQPVGGWRTFLKGTSSTSSSTSN